MKIEDRHKQLRFFFIKEATADEESQSFLHSIGLRIVLSGKWACIPATVSQLNYRKLYTESLSAERHAKMSSRK